MILAKHREKFNIALYLIGAKAFKNTASLYSHLSDHKQEQIYQCEVCDK